MPDYSALYPSLRVFLGDINTVAPAYSNAQLDLFIEVAIGLDAMKLGQDPDLSLTVDKMRVALRAAIEALSPTSGEMSWRTRAFGVSRGNNWQAHLSHLSNVLRQFEDGGIAARGETEWDQWLRGTSDTVAALASFPG